MFEASMEGHLRRLQVTEFSGHLLEGKEKRESGTTGKISKSVWQLDLEDGECNWVEINNGLFTWPPLSPTPTTIGVGHNRPSVNLMETKFHCGRHFIFLKLILCLVIVENHKTKEWIGLLKITLKHHQPPSLELRTRSLFYDPLKLNVKKKQKQFMLISEIH